MKGLAEELRAQRERAQVFVHGENGKLKDEKLARMVSDCLYNHEDILLIRQLVVENLTPTMQ